jgi:predicted nucleotidyltransferase
MATTRLPTDFREFLQSLGEHGARYLLIGGYAVGYHGHARPTGDLDVWVETTKDNLERVVAALHQFGFDMPDVSVNLFSDPDTILRFGYPPLRIELMTQLSGVTFEECYAQRVTDDLDGVKVTIINLQDLKLNKRAAGRHKDLADLEELP